MKKRWISIMLVTALLSTSAVFAAEAPEIQNSLSGEVNNYNESEITMPSDAEVTAMDGLREQLYGGVDNSDLEVDIVWEKSGKKRVIYSGRLGDYLFGIYRHVDFTGIEYQIIFSTLGVTDDVIYIVPKSEKAIEDVMNELTPEGDGKFSSSTAASGSTIKCDVNLMYDGTYHEKIMIKNKQLTVPIKLTNTGSAAKDITCFIGEYDADGRLINEIESTPVRVGANTSVAATLIREFDKSAKSAKIFIWEDGTMRPITNTILLTETETDYYANSLTQAQEYDIAYPIEGRINTSGDVDYIKFVPENSGEHAFNCVSASSILTTLYNANQSALQSNSAKYNYTLTAGQIYYVRVSGSNTTGEYILSVQYNASEEAKGFDVYKFDEDVNIYKKSILDICNEFYTTGNIDLAKQMYSEYDSILDKDAKLHLLPDFLSDHPKNLSNFDDLLNQYYGIRYDKFIKVKQEYIALIDKYTEDTDMGTSITDKDSINSEEKISLKKPIIGKSYPQSIVGESTASGNHRTGNERLQTAATPSLTIVRTTATTITYNATFPVSGQWGNVIGMIDFNTPDGLTAKTNVYGTDVNRSNGQYTISGLSPGGIYILLLAWSTDNQNIGYENTICRFVQLPNNTTENLKVYTGGRVTARLEQADKELASASDFNTWLNNMDKAYNAYKELTGYTPYNSKKIEMRSTRDNLNDEMDITDGHDYWEVIFGYYDYTNVFKHARAFYQGHMRRLSKGDWGDTPLHELSHVFDNYKWEFDSETLAQLKLYYVITQLNAKVYRPDRFDNNGNGWYTGSNYYELLKYDRYLDSYTASFDENTYASEGFAVILIDIQKQIGWEPFKKTFRYFSDLSSSQVPRTDGAKLKLFLTKLKDYSGRDILNIITARDKRIIEDWFNIDLEYAEPVYPSVTPGGSSGGGRYDVNIDKGKYTTYQFTPSTSGNYYIYTTPYGGSGVSNDTVLEVYTNSSLSGTPIASNDDYDGGRFSKVNVAMTAGTTYYIKVRHYNNGTLHAELNITKNIPVQQLTSGGYQDAYTAAGEYAMFSFTPDTSMTYVFEVTNTSNYEPYIKLYENESMTKRIGYGSTKIMANLKAGHTYYLQFSGFLMKYARGRINVRQGQTVQFSKKNDSSFIYVNSPEYITRFDIVDDISHTQPVLDKTIAQPYMKLAEFENVTGKNTFYETHTAWWGDLVKVGNETYSYDPLQQFYMDIDFYNPTSNTITVSIKNLAYGVSYEDLKQYYNGGYSFDVTIEPYSHIPILSHIGAPLLCREKEGKEWAKTPVILFDFVVHSGSVTVSSLAAYNSQNLYLRAGTMNVVDTTGAVLDDGAIILAVDDDGNPAWQSSFDPRRNETDLYTKMKGIAKSESAWIDANIDLVVDENTELGTPIPLYLKDDYYTYGIANPKWSWKSSISPLNDAWDGVLMMLPNGLHNFKYHYGNTGREWNFDFIHRNLAHIDINGNRSSINDPVPADIIDNAKRDMASGTKNHFPNLFDPNTGENIGHAPDNQSLSFGEWGATYHYTVTAANTTDKARNIYIKMWSADNMVFGLKKQGESTYATSYHPRIYNTPDNPTNTAVVSVSAYSTITFEFVTLLGAGLGGLNHSIVVE